MKFDLYYSWLKLKTILTYDWENPYFLYLIPLPLVIILIFAHMEVAPDLSGVIQINL